MQNKVDKFIVIPREASDLHRTGGLSSSGLTTSSLVTLCTKMLNSPRGDRDGEHKPTAVEEWPNAHRLLYM